MNWFIAVGALIIVVMAAVIISERIVTRRRKEKELEDKGKGESKSLLKGDLAGDMRPLRGKEQYARKCGYWICDRCETCVPLAQKTCFICNNSYRKKGGEE